VNEVFVDEELYPRVQPFYLTISEYKQSMLSGTKFPPITLALFHNKLVLVDGRHRLEATKKLKKETIEAEIFAGWDKKKIYVEAVIRNNHHGQKLSPFEKRRAVLKLREMNINDSEIAKLIQIPESVLENFVGQRLVSTPTGQIIVKAPLKHLAGQKLSASRSREVEIYQEPLTTKSQVNLFDQIIDLFESGLIDKDNEEVQERIIKLSDLISGAD